MRLILLETTIELGITRSWRTRHAGAVVVPWVDWNGDLPWRGDSIPVIVKNCTNRRIIKKNRLTFSWFYCYFKELLQIIQALLLRLAVLLPLSLPSGMPLIMLLLIESNMKYGLGVLHAFDWKKIEVREKISANHTLIRDWYPGYIFRKKKYNSIIKK